MRPAIRMGHGNNNAFLSQIYTSATNFLTSLAAIRFLDGDAFRYWCLFVPGVLIVQGFLRSSFYEINMKKLSQTNITKVFGYVLVSSSPFGFLLLTKFSIESSLFLIATILYYAGLVIIQDFFRYKNLATNVELVAKSDLIWLIFTITTFLFLSIYQEAPNHVILGIFIIGPVFALIPLIFGVNNQYVGNEAGMKIDRTHVSVFIFLTGFTTLISGLFLNTYTVVNFSMSDLQNYRIIFSFIGPVQTVGFAIWTQKIVNSLKSDLNFTFEPRRKLILTTLFYWVFLFASINLFYQAAIISQSLLILAIVAMHPIILNICMYDFQIQLRHCGQYQILVFPAILANLILIVSLISLSQALQIYSFVLWSSMPIFLASLLRIVWFFSSESRSKGMGRKS